MVPHPSQAGMQSIYYFERGPVKTLLTCYLDLFPRGNTLSDDDSLTPRNNVIFLSLWTPLTSFDKW